MHICIKALYDEIRKDPTIFHSSKYETLLELLWYFHTQYFPVPNDSIHAHFSDLEQLLCSLSQKRKRKLLYSVYQLCEEYEHAAFLQGIRVGAQLMIEVSDNT